VGNSDNSTGERPATVGERFGRAGETLLGGGCVAQSLTNEARLSIHSDEGNFAARKL
jgi:hypothetical protein